MPTYLEGKRVTILHTNDNHGRFWQNENKEYGMSARQTLLKDLRKKAQQRGSQVLLLSAGDINTGVPESDLQYAKPDLLGMDLMGYDAMVLGNHEFDNPLSVLREQQLMVSFPFIGANVVYKKNKKPIVEPYKIFVKSGIKIAVLGLTTEDILALVNPEHLKNIDILNPIKTANKYLPRLNHQADMVIALTHMGYYPDGQYGQNAPGDVTLAKQTKGLDLVVGGHTHVAVCMTPDGKLDEAYYPRKPCVPDLKNGVYIVQAHEWGKYVGQADFVFRGGQWLLEDYQLFPVNYPKTASSDIIPDAQMLSLLKPYQKIAQKKLNIPVARLYGRLDGDRHNVRAKRTNLGVLIATAQMQAVSADLGVMNGGGIRDSIEPGVVTYRDILRVQPFANLVSYVDVSGRELKTILAKIASIPSNSGGFAHFAGVKFQFRHGRVEQVVVFGKGSEKQVEDAGTYRMSINSFSASGGDKYPVLNNKPYFVNSGLKDAAVLRDYLAKKKTIRASDYLPDHVVLQD